MKRLIAFIACALLLVGLLAGCKPSQQELLVGTWRGEADLAVAYETMLAGLDPAMTGHIDITSFRVEMILEFDEDGTYTRTADAEDVRVGTENMMNAIASGLATYLQIETGMSIDQLLNTTGKTMDSLMAEYFDPNMDQIVMDALSFSGRYEIKKNELTLVDEYSFVIFEGDVELTEDTLDLENGVTEELITHLMPMTFERD
jgi:hypothetical protein